MSLSKPSPGTSAFSLKAPLRIQKVSGSKKKKNAELKATRHWCDSCSTGFANGPYLHRHWQQMHIFQKECVICDAQLEDDELVHLHMRRVHKLKKFFSCSCCKWIFLTEDDLRKHEKSMSDSGHPGVVRPAMKLIVQDLRPKKLRSVPHPTAKVAQEKNEPNEMIVQVVEKPPKLEAGPRMRQVMSAGSMYPALFVYIGGPETEASGISNSMKKPAAQKTSVGSRQGEEPKCEKVVRQVMDKNICSAGAMMEKTTWTEAEKEAYDTILATLMLGTKNIKPAIPKPLSKAPKLQKANQAPGLLNKQNKKK
ncbi:hypothetical protein CAEBREN_05435 [Caenorhabditis brenneri]|uniref:C2H2-type domain-containing protein n=1 Tax=Caenorhabditis brenneri TaxID=135651 RepID=G0MGZ2_CAEBE|nr:hypothetical protein CAEBREN_05435 [Caenorhabditis brenneri]